MKKGPFSLWASVMHLKNFVKNLSGQAQRIRCVICLHTYYHSSALVDVSICKAFLRLRLQTSMFWFCNAQICCQFLTGAHTRKQNHLETSGTAMATKKRERFTTTELPTKSVQRNELNQCPSKKNGNKINKKQIGQSGVMVAAYQFLAGRILAKVTSTRLVKLKNGIITIQK